MKIQLLMFLALIATTPNLKANSIHWETDYQIAFKRAQLQKKPLLVFFSGSDWCIWCRKLEIELFNSDVVSEKLDHWAIPVYLDFPQEKQLKPTQERANRILKERWNVNDFPTVLLISQKTEKIIWRHSYIKIDAAEYLDTIREAYITIRNP